MALVVGNASHVDHGITLDILMHILEKFKSRRGFFIDTVTLPRKLGQVPCGLYGPIMGDPPVPLDKIQMVKRPKRHGPSPMIDLPPRPTRKLTVIAGPEAEFDTYLFTVFGGPLTPREPHDPDITDEEEREASTKFWSMHALSTQV